MHDLEPTGTDRSECGLGAGRLLVDAIVCRGCGAPFHAQVYQERAKSHG
jgi:hypothetical protein